MRLVLVALAGMLILSGCAGSPRAAPQQADLGPTEVPEDGTATTTATAGAPAEEAPPTEVEDSGPKSLFFEGTFSLTVTHAYIPSAAPGQGQQRYNLDPNCVGFGKDQVWLMLNGTAEATWSNPGPFAQKMTLDIRDIALMATNNGTASPSVLEYGRFQTVPNALLGLWFIVQPTDPGVVVQQPVSLHIAFHYLGVPDLKTVVEPCVYTAAFEDEEVDA
jgi:hypothetical protein